MSFLYPQTVSIYRPRANASDSVGSLALGAQPYQGVEQSHDASNPNAEDLIASGVACVIHAQGVGRARGTGTTPSDAPGPEIWKIICPASALTYGQVRDRDIAVDDIGYRYQIAASEWSMLGYTLHAIRVEA